MSNEKARSPYQKYGKSPYRYSPGYQAWRSAVLNQNERHVAEARRAHDAQLRREAPFPFDESRKNHHQIGMAA